MENNRIEKYSTDVSEILINCILEALVEEGLISASLLIAVKTRLMIQSEETMSGTVSTAV